ncbi:rho GTPase-activating protein 24 [Pelomyxa schiedti]|nr:rho GTPase-activating protein 24 [Pelomyxa schiedti]
MLRRKTISWGIVILCFVFGVLMQSTYGRVVTSFMKSAPPSSTRAKFGQALDPNSGDVPQVVVACLKALVKFIREPGIFRISGSAVLINSMTEKWNKGQEPDLDSIIVPHTITGLLKAYLRSLPQPLLTFELYDKFIEVADGIYVVVSPLTDLLLDTGTPIPTRLQRIREIVHQLPPTYFYTTKYLLGFMKDVTGHSDENQMTSANIATCIASNILRPKSEKIEFVVTHTPLVNWVVEMMISSYDNIFEGQYPTPATSSNTSAPIGTPPDASEQAEEDSAWELRESAYTTFSDLQSVIALIQPRLQNQYSEEQIAYAMKVVAELCKCQTVPLDQPAIALPNQPTLPFSAAFYLPDETVKPMESLLGYVLSYADSITTSISLLLTPDEISPYLNRLVWIHTALRSLESALR